MGYGVGRKNPEKTRMLPLKRATRCRNGLRSIWCTLSKQLLWARKRNLSEQQHNHSGTSRCRPRSHADASRPGG